jgi:hypothetical protein
LLSNNLRHSPAAHHRLRLQPPHPYIRRHPNPLTFYAPDSWPVKMGPTVVSRMSSTNLTYTPCKTPKPKYQYSLHGESLKSRMYVTCFSISSFQNCHSIRHNRGNSCAWTECTTLAWWYIWHPVLVKWEFIQSASCIFWTMWSGHQHPSTTVMNGASICLQTICCLKHLTSLNTHHQNFES